MRLHMTPLMDACMDGEVQIVQTLFKSKSVSAEVLNKQVGIPYMRLAMHYITAGSTVLHAACLKGYVELVKAILNEPNSRSLWCAQDVDGCTPLWNAIKEGHLTVVQAMLLHATDKIDLQGEESKIEHLYNIPWNGLILAVQENHLEMAQELLRYKYGYLDIDVNREDDAGNTALLVAIQENNVDMVKELLHHAQIDVNIRSSLTSQTPLLCALENNSADVLQLLLSREELELSIDGQHPLYYSAMHGFAESVQALLDCRRIENVNIETAFGFTALGTALNNGHEAVALALIADTRVDVTSNQKNLNSQTPLEYAVSDVTLLDVVRALVARTDVNVNEFSHNESGRSAASHSSPLHTAIRCANVEAIVILLATPGIDINLRDPSNGNHALHLAALMRGGKVGGGGGNKSDVIYRLLMSDQRIDKRPVNHAHEVPEGPTRVMEGERRSL